MRIIAGDFRGRALASVGKGDEGAHLRPTTDRVRESLFNVLVNGFGDPVTDARVLDLFAGTGALGLEALSRGAESVVFVESGRKGQALIAENIRLCRAEGRAKLIKRDVRKLGPADGVFDLVFLDPPYGKGLGEVALERAIAGGWIADGAVIVWEESADVIAPEGVHVEDVRRYGDTKIAICRFEG